VLSRYDNLREPPSCWPAYPIRFPVYVIERVALPAIRGTSVPGRWEEVVLSVGIGNKEKPARSPAELRHERGEHKDVRLALGLVPHGEYFAAMCPCMTATPACVYRRSYLNRGCGQAELQKSPTRPKRDSEIDMLPSLA
jgi:hypothetical protein